MLKTAKMAGRTTSVIEIWILRALALEAQNDLNRALSYLERAFELAEPRGYVRTFVDVGKPMARLLREAAECGIAPTCASRLLTAMDAQKHQLYLTYRLARMENANMIKKRRDPHRLRRLGQIVQFAFLVVSILARGPISFWLSHFQVGFPYQSSGHLFDDFLLWRPRLCHHPTSLPGGQSGTGGDGQ